MSKSEVHGGDRLFGWLGIALGWLLWGVMSVARLHAQVPDISWRRAAWYGMPDALVWALLTPLVIHLVRLIDASKRSSWQAMPLHLVAGVGVAFLHSTGDAGIAAVRNLVGGHQPFFGAIFRKVLTHTFQLNLLMYFLVAGLTYYVLYSRRLSQRKRRNAELRAQLTEAQLTSLQTQLRPHFLFNALHTISSFMETDPERGQRVVRQLGDLLRASLKARDTQTVPLADELALVRSYLDVEKARFGDRLAIDFDVDADLAGAQVPALLLQPIVENAVRHGVSRNAKGGRVSIRAARRGDMLQLRVEDNGPGLVRSAATDSEGVGLANTRERLRALYGNAHGFSIEPADPQGVHVTIALPCSERPAA